MADVFDCLNSFNSSLQEKEPLWSSTYRIKYILLPCNLIGGWQSWAGHIWNIEWFCFCLRWGYSYEAMKEKWKGFLNSCGAFCPDLDRHKEWYGIPLRHVIHPNHQVKKTVCVILSWMALLRMILEKIVLLISSWTSVRYFNPITQCRRIPDFCCYCFCDAVFCVNGS